MKHVLINAGLVTALLGLFIIPMSGFSFLRYDNQQKNVLGASDVRYNMKKNSLSEVNIVDQVDVMLHLGSGTSQVFYNVLPKKYLNSHYKFVVVLQNKYTKRGIEANIIKGSSGINLKLEVSPDFDITEEVPISILILE